MYSACPDKIASKYPGRDVCIVGCDPVEACLGDNYCAYGECAALASMDESARL